MTVLPALAACGGGGGAAGIGSPYARLLLDTAARVGNAQAWVTNEYEHDGIGEDRVFARLTDLVRDMGGGITGD
jgi:hypothetical protein